MMNNDWNFYSNMEFVVAQLLAGSIIRNTMNGKTIMINTVEVYGRTKSVDIHREPFGTKKNKQQLKLHYHHQSRQNMKAFGQQH